MWTISMFFFELRLAVSAILLLYEWYKLGFLDSYIHYSLEKELSRLSCLPVVIEKLRLQIEGGVGFAWIIGLQIKAPAVQDDDRWELEHMVTVDLVEIKFPVFTSFVAYMLSFGELAILDTVSIYGLKAFVEGYRNCADELSFNVNLIGKRSVASVVHIDGSKTVEEITINSGLENAVILEDYFSGQLISGTTSHSIKVNSKRDAEQDTNKHTIYIQDEYNSLYQTAKSKLSNVYEKTKHTISESISDRISALHVNLCGPEPMHFPGEFRFICNYLHYDVIEIHMCRALPIQLRHLEQKPLVVHNLSLFNLGIPKTLLTFNNSSDWKGELREYNTKDDSPTKLIIPPQLHNGGNYLIIFWENVDLYEDGMDIRIFKYRFERKMLHALCKQNAGRIAYDFFNFGMWHASSYADSNIATDHFEQDAMHSHPIFFHEC